MLLPARKEKKHFFCSIYNKTIIGFSFLIDIQDNQGLGKGYQLKPKASQKPHPIITLFVIFINSFVPRMIIRDWNCHDHCVSINVTIPLFKLRAECNATR